ncbi:hypothetical protein BDA96_01G264500 [Sorghum bicolor]|uniref:GST N-terminal domain-containing protein n=1 Tax=Sorghum bicolor TaxID=4558 RepID=A0A921S055_SORBI|nr:hypothetical protein BDA96_01G264500 [Sorghum bicolor]
MTAGTMRLLGGEVSPFAARARLALELRGVAYELLDEPLGPKKSDRLLAANPVYGKIPGAAPPRRPRHMRVRRHRPVRRGRRAGKRRRRGWRPAAAGRPIRARHAPLLDRLHRRQVLAGAGRRLAGADRGRTRAGRGRHPRRAKPPGGGVQGPQQRRGFLLRPRRGAGPPGPGTRLLPAGAQGLRAAPRPLPHRRVHDAAPGRVEPALRRAPGSQARPAGHGQGGAVHEVPPGKVRGPRVMNDFHCV